MSYRCNICNKDYSSYQSLWIHTKKFHNQKVTNDNQKVTNSNQKVTNDNQNIVNPSNKNICKYCNKKFNHKQNKWLHEKKHCNTKISLQEENKKLTDELNNIKKNIMTNSNNTNSNNINNNNGIINNNYIYINSIGTEKVTDLSIKDIKKISNSSLNGVITCTKKLNFNKKLPQYHSFCATTLEGKHFTKINEKSQKPEKINKKDFINEILYNSIKIINDIGYMIEFDEDFRSNISLNDQNKIQEIIKNQHKFYETKNKKAFFNCINDISYNYKDIILKTWDQLKTIDNNTDNDTDNDTDNYIDNDIDKEFIGYISSDTDNELKFN
jgi:hypothetical protein